MTIIERDLRHIWHPCSQMKDYQTFKPLHVVSARGSYLELVDGRRVIDAISSWWCKSLGHNHPHLKQALQKQLEQFEHVILANTTNDLIVNLSEKLAALTKTLHKVFFAGDGSSAVEIAMKMSLHARQIQGQPQRCQFVALENSYHGETTGALSVSDLGLYRDAYHSILFPTHFISPGPYITGQADPAWQNIEDAWPAIVKKLEPFGEIMTAVIVEPIVQGASGMKIYSPDFLRRLRIWTAERGIHLIADEIMTGIGRTGKMLACQHADIEPDFLCLSKGLTSGWLAFSAMLTSDKIYDLFYDDYAAGKSFLHSNTYTGNALGASVALATLEVMEQEKICERVVNQIAPVLRNYMQEVAEATGKLTNIRSIGAIVATDLINDDPQRRLGFEVYQKATELGALLRPIGNTLYWLPPLNISLETLQELRNITEQAITLSFRKTR